MKTRPAGLQRGTPEDGAPPDGVEILADRKVPLGGPRAMTVRRTLPQRSRTLIGAWCFADHYGPDDVAESGGMDVARFRPSCAKNRPVPWRSAIHALMTGHDGLLGDPVTAWRALAAGP